MCKIQCRTLKTVTRVTSSVLASELWHVKHEIFYFRVCILLIYARKENINNWNGSFMQMLHGSRFTEVAAPLTPFCCRSAQATPHPDQVFPGLADEPRGPGAGQGEGEGRVLVWLTPCCRFARRTRVCCWPTSTARTPTLRMQPTSCGSSQSKTTQTTSGLSSSWCRQEKI